MQHKFYPGIEFEPVEDAKLQKPKDNIFDMRPEVCWKLLQRFVRGTTPKLQKVLDNKDPVERED